MMGKKWTGAEIETLHRLYPTGGSRAVQAALPHRGIPAIQVAAWKRGVRAALWIPRCTRPSRRFPDSEILLAYAECGHSKVAHALLREVDRLREMAMMLDEIAGRILHARKR